MLSSFCKTFVFLAAVLLQAVSAQQYLGDVIVNASYPSVPGSEITYFRVKDPAGKNNNLTLVNYESHGSTGKRIDPLKVKRAVIIIHGLNRDPGTYMSNMLSALSQVTTDSNINFDSVVINAPSFPNGDDKNVTYPYWTYPPGAKKAASGGAQSFTNALVWKGSQWAGGGTNQYPVKNPSVSSYDVLDQLIQYYSNKTIFPNVNQVVIAGHSLGGQTVQRYAAVGKPLSTLGVTVPVTYWIANPNSLVWLNSSRPLSTAGCSDYDAWREGLSNYTDYPSIYNNALVASGPAAVLANYKSKSKAYARGTLDLGDDSSGCEPFTTGANRNERFFYFINWWTPTCEAPTSATGHCDTVDLIPMGHDGGGMMASSGGLARLFTDNFYGDGARSYDFGYPRIQPNVDDPYPNPAYNQSSSSASNTVYAGNMTYVGCYTDGGGSDRTLANMLYDSTSNTIEKCTSACNAAGYTVAGMEYGSQCFCDNALGPYTERVLDLGCSEACPGNSSETCGQSNRLSIYSNGTPSVSAAPSNAEVVGNYYYAGCHNESTSGRALSATSYSDGKNMTLENCAAFCNGYQYFGVEYAAECYCGSYFGVGSAIAPDSSCSMVCNGNKLELCGGPGALSVYELEAGSPVSTIVQGSAPTAPTGTASSLPSSSLCPATNGQTIADSNNATYTIGCSSDTNIGSYSSTSAVSSYFDCMTACDNAASSGCVAFTYVGGAYGSGSGTCYLKNSQGSFSASGTNLVSGFKMSGGVSVTTTSSGSAATSSSTSGIPSASLCPATNGQTIADSNNNTYTIACSSDTNIGSYSSTSAVKSYFDCMVACDNAVSTGCVAFTYVGGTYGSGSGTCYLKTSQGSFSAAGSNLVSGFKSSSGVVITTTSSSSYSNISSTLSSATASSTSNLCPAVDSQDVTDSNGKTYTIKCSSDTNIGSFANAQAVHTYADCMTVCDSTTGCVAFTYVGGAYGQGSGTCWMKSSLGSATSAGGNNYIAGFLKQTTSTLSSTASSVSSSSISSNFVTSSSVSSSSVSSTSSSSSTISSSTGVPSASLCPQANGQIITDSNGNTYNVTCSADNSVGSYTNSQASASYLDCMVACDAAASTGCQGFTYVGGASGSGSGTCWLKQSMANYLPTGNNYISAVKVANTGSTGSSGSSSSSSTTQTSTSSSSSSSVSSTSSSTSSSSSSTSSSVSSTSSASQTTSSSSSSATTLSTITSSTASSSSTALSLPTGFASYGCFVDSSTRALAYSAYSTSTNTPYKCASTCQSLGYKYAGTEYGSECWCSNTAPTNSAPSTDCKMACTGDSTQVCGNGNRLSVYVDNTWTSKFAARASYGTWNLMACYIDGTNGRVLPQTMSMTGGSSNATIANCLNACAKSGLKVCGAEFYSECYGSSAAPSASLIAGSDPLTAGCNYPCTGNKTEACGGSNRILVYVNNGTIPSRR